MKSVTIKASPRTLTGGTGSKKLRQDGKIPAVIYGRETKPQSLQVEEHEFTDVMHHHASESLLVDLQLEGKSRLALVQEVQHHPLTRGVIHIDFHEVSEKETVHVTVPVETQGEAPGVKAGGVLEHVRHSLKIKARPRDLPETIFVDVSGLEVNRAVHVRDITPPAGVELDEDPEQVVVSCAAPRVEVEEAPEEEAEPAAGAGAAEVEMIKEKKDEGEGKASEGAQEKK